jgi:CDP-diacylglycerol--glycerol-3-phosphate 3-phosphatidyltransferase
MFDGQFRKQVDATVRPIGRGLARAGVTPDVITGIGLVMSLAAAISIGAGAFSLGLLLVVLTGIPDLLDGAVAKASGRSSVRGAFFDSVSDRITDAMLFTGLAYFFASSGEPAWVVMLPVAGYATASWVSYLRAKADALGFDAHVGLVERAERIMLLVVGLLFGGPVLVGILITIVALNLVTAGQRFAAVWSQATDATPTLSARRDERAERRRRRNPVSSRSAAERRAERAERRRRATGRRIG